MNVEARSCEVFSRAVVHKQVYQSRLSCGSCLRLRCQCWRKTCTARHSTRTGCRCVHHHSDSSHSLLCGLSYHNLLHSLYSPYTEIIHQPSKRVKTFFKIFSNETSIKTFIRYKKCTSNKKWTPCKKWTPHIENRHRVNLLHPMTKIFKSSI